MDPSVIALAKAIRQTESNNNFTQKGASGEMGGYQWMPGTWQTHAKNVLGDPNAAMTPENQNAVAYVTLKQWKDQGLNPAQIAAKWNSGSEAGWENKVGKNSQGVAYDVPAYVKKVTDLYQTFRPQNSSNPLGATPAYASDGSQPQQQSQGGPAFPYQPGDNGLTAGLKAIGNTPGSLVGFVKNTAQGFNPIQAVSNLEQIGSGFGELAGSEGYGKAFMDVLRGIPEAAYHSLVPEGVRHLISGDVGGAAQSFTNDPFGQAAPLVLAAEGGAKLLDRATGRVAPGGEAVPGKTMYVDPNGGVSGPRGAATAAFDNAVSSVGGAAIDLAKKGASPVAPLANAAMGGLGTLSRSLASHLTALAPETISQIIEDPSMFSKVVRDQMNRSNVFDQVKTGLSDLKDSYGDNGKLYEAIKADATTKVVIPEDFIGNVLSKYGFKLDKGQVVADSNSITRNTSDINALQKFVDDWGHMTELSPKEYLNMRKDAGQNIARYGKDIGKNADAARVGSDIYDQMNQTMRPQIKGLKELDAAASPQIKLIEQVKKDFMNKDGSFKDNAPSKIFNALNKEGLLSRLETLRPGITKQIQILRAVEDIERAMDIKVGAYARGAVEGFAVSGAPGAIVAAILSNPTIAVPLIRGLGWSKAQVIPVIKVLRTMAGDFADKTASAAGGMSQTANDLRPLATVAATANSNNK